VPSDGSGDLSFTRASNGTRVNSAGLVEVVSWNLVQQSETLSVSPWGTADVTITDNSQTAPNGTSTADVLTEGTGTAQHRIYQTTSFSSGIYTVSAYVKNITGTRQAYIDLGPFTAFFTFSTETIYSASGVASFEKLANGWYRISLTSANPITPSTIYVGLGQGNTETYTGNGTSAIAFWGIQYNIGSTAKPYFPTTDRLNVPRLTYQNGGGGCPSLLLEKQSTNLITYSEDFSGATWTNEDIIVSTNQTISPDGTQNADKLIANTTTLDHSIYQTSTGNTRTFSVYAKAGEYNYIFLGSNNNIASDGAFFNLSNGTISQNTSGLTASIESVGNGWYRCIVSSTSWPTIYTIICLSTNGTSLQFTGNNTSGIYVWGAQVEQSSYPTSYIPTTNASATRVADACFKTGISSLIGQTEGFIAGEVEGLTNSYGSQSTIMSVSDGTTANRVIFSFNATAGYVTPRIFKAGSTIFVNDYPITLTQKIKFSIGWGGGRAVCYVNGTQVLETTGLTFFSSGTLTRFGADDGAGSNIGIGKVSEYILGTSNLTNAELQSLTI
jgi:hypothetical protein